MEHKLYFRCDFSGLVVKKQGPIKCLDSNFNNLKARAKTCCLFRQIQGPRCLESDSGCFVPTGNCHLQYLLIPTLYFNSESIVHAMFSYKGMSLFAGDIFSLCRQWNFVTDIEWSATNRDEVWKWWISLGRANFLSQNSVPIFPVKLGKVLLKLDNIAIVTFDSTIQTVVQLYIIFYAQYSLSLQALFHVPEI